jgi:hypothetical protein
VRVLEFGKQKRSGLSAGGFGARGRVSRGEKTGTSAKQLGVLLGVLCASEVAEDKSFNEPSK